MKNLFTEENTQKLGSLEENEGYFIIGTFTATAMFNSVYLAHKCPSSLSLSFSQCT